MWGHSFLYIYLVIILVIYLFISLIGTQTIQINSYGESTLQYDDAGSPRTVKIITKIKNIQMKLNSPNIKSHFYSCIPDVSSVQEGPSCLLSWFRRKQVSTKEKIKAVQYCRWNRCRWPAWHTDHWHNSNEKRSLFKLTINTSSVFLLYFSLHLLCFFTDVAVTLISFSVHSRKTSLMTPFLLHNYAGNGQWNRFYVR